MLRTISISTDVFAAIWARHQDGEETEDAILRRLLDCDPAVTPVQLVPPANGSGGILDARNGVHFPEGFVAFRNYKHREYRATATNGVWVREDTGQSYPTLNQVNASIAAGAENIWNGNWKYRASDGSVRSIDRLRS